MARFEETPGWHSGIAEFSRETLADVVQQVHEIADRAVPVRTGYLKSRLYSQVSVDGTEGVVGDDADYALYVEDGHRVAYRGADGEIHYTGTVVPPQPFLRVGLNSARVRERGS
jgi:hypothetical protein